MATPTFRRKKRRQRKAKAAAKAAVKVAYRPPGKGSPPTRRRRRTTNVRPKAGGKRGGKQPPKQKPTPQKPRGGKGKPKPDVSSKVDPGGGGAPSGGGGGYSSVNATLGGAGVAATSAAAADQPGGQSPAQAASQAAAAYGPSGSDFASDPPASGASAASSAEAAAYRKAKRQYQAEQRRIAKARRYASEIADKNERQRAQSKITERENELKKPEKPESLAAEQGLDKLGEDVGRIVRRNAKGFISATAKFQKQLRVDTAKALIRDELRDRYGVEIPDNVSNKEAAKKIDKAVTRDDDVYRDRTDSGRAAAQEALNKERAQSRAVDRKEEFTKEKTSDRDTLQDFVIPEYRRKVVRDAARTEREGLKLRTGTSYLSQAQRRWAKKEARTYAQKEVRESKRYAKLFGAVPEQGPAFWMRVRTAARAAPSEHVRQVARRTLRNQGEMEAEWRGRWRVDLATGRLKMNTPSQESVEKSGRKRARDVKAFEAYEEAHPDLFSSDWFEKVPGDLLQAAKDAPDSFAELAEVGFEIGLHTVNDPGRNIGMVVEDLMSSDPEDDITAEMPRTAAFVKAGMDSSPTFQFWKNVVKTGSFDEAADLTRPLYEENRLGVLGEMMGAFSFGAGQATKALTLTRANRAIAAKGGLKRPHYYARARALQAARPAVDIDSRKTPEVHKDRSLSERRKHTKKQRQEARNRQDTQANVGPGKPGTEQKYSRFGAVRAAQKAQENVQSIRGTDPFAPTGKVARKKVDRANKQWARASKAAGTVALATAGKTGIEVVKNSKGDVQRTAWEMVASGAIPMSGPEVPAKIAAVRAAVGESDVPDSVKAVNEKLLDDLEANYDSTGNVGGGKASKLQAAVEDAAVAFGKIEDDLQKAGHHDDYQARHRKTVQAYVLRNEAEFVRKGEPLPGQPTREKATPQDRARLETKRKQRRGIKARHREAQKTYRRALGRIKAGAAQRVFKAGESKKLSPGARDRIRVAAERMDTAEKNTDAAAAERALDRQIDQLESEMDQLGGGPGWKMGRITGEPDYVARVPKDRRAQTRPDEFKAAGNEGRARVSADQPWRGGTRNMRFSRDRMGRDERIKGDRPQRTADDVDADLVKAQDRIDATGKELARLRLRHDVLRQEHKGEAVDPEFLKLVDATHEGDLDRYRKLEEDLDRFLDEHAELEREKRGLDEWTQRTPEEAANRKMADLRAAHKVLVQQRKRRGQKNRPAQKLDELEAKVEAYGAQLKAIDDDIFSITGPDIKKAYRSGYVHIDWKDRPEDEQYVLIPDEVDENVSYFSPMSKRPRGRAVGDPNLRQAESASSAGLRPLVDRSFGKSNPRVMLENRANLLNYIRMMNGFIAMSPIKHSMTYRQALIEMRVAAERKGGMRYEAVSAGRSGPVDPSKLTPDDWAAFRTEGFKPDDEVYLVPEGTVKLFKKIHRKRGLLLGSFSWVTQRFVIATLPLSVAWQAGNAIDQATRLLIAGVNPITDRNLWRQVEKQGKDLPFWDELVAHLQGHLGSQEQAIQNTRYSSQISGSRFQSFVRANEGLGDSTLGRILRTPGEIPQAGFNVATRIEGFFIDPVKGQIARQMLEERGILFKDLQEMSNRFLDMMRNPDDSIRMEVASEFGNRVTGVVGDYSRGFGAPADLASAIDPFWTWVRESVKLVAYTLPVKHPTKAALALQIIQAQALAGEELELDGTEGLTGFLRGAIPVESMGPGWLIPTTPFTSFGEITKMLDDPIEYMVNRPIPYANKLGGAALARPWWDTFSDAVLQKIREGEPLMADIPPGVSRREMMANSLLESFAPGYNQAEMIAHQGGFRGGYSGLFQAVTGAHDLDSQNKVPIYLNPAINPFAPTRNLEMRGERTKAREAGKPETAAQKLARETAEAQAGENRETVPEEVQRLAARGLERARRAARAATYPGFGNVGEGKPMRPAKPPGPSRKEFLKAVELSPGLPGAEDLGIKNDRQIIDKIHPELQKSLIDLSEQTGIKPVINEGFRTYEYQAKLAADPSIDIVAPAGSSKHESGLAVDIDNYADYSSEQFQRAGVGQLVEGDPEHLQLLNEPPPLVGPNKVEPKPRALAGPERQFAKRFKKQVRGSVQITGLPSADAETFARAFAESSGLSYKVAAAAVLREGSNELYGDNNWLNIGHTDSGPASITSDPAWQDPAEAGRVSGLWLDGRWGQQYDYVAADAIQAISAGESDQEQMARWASSGWASSGAGPGDTYGQVGVQVAPLAPTMMKRAEKVLGRRRVQNIIASGGSDGSATVESREVTGALPGPYDGSRTMVRNIVGTKVRGDKEEGHSSTGDHDPSQPNAYAQDINQPTAYAAEHEPAYNQESLDQIVANLREMGADVPDMQLGADDWEGNVNGYDVQILTVLHGSGPHIHAGARWAGTPSTEGVVLSGSAPVSGAVPVAGVAAPSGAVAAPTAAPAMADTAAMLKAKQKRKRSRFRRPMSRGDRAALALSMLRGDIDVIDYVMAITGR